MRSPTLSELFDHIFESRFQDLHVALPARVEKYDPTFQRIDAKPLIKKAFLDEDETRQLESLPVIPGVPVVFPGSGGFRVTFPIEAGDEVLLIFSESALDAWLTYGGEVDPVDDRRFSLSDAIAIPGLRNFANPLSSAPTDRATFGKDTGPQIHVDDTEIRLGANDASDFVALASLVLAELQAIRTAFNNHVHPETGVTTDTPLVPMPAPSSVAATIVKAK